jgi:hypothetical protein
MRAIRSPFVPTYRGAHLPGGRRAVNVIGVAGEAGFGVGVAPSLPIGFTAMEGNETRESANYGNYTYTDGSVMVWIPAFYYRIGSASSPRYATYGANAIDIVPFGAFADVAAANASGYALHRAFYDGGAVQPGFFVDKYLCSNNGGTASSIALGNPLSTAAAHNPLSGLTGTPANAYYGCIDAAKTRGSRFFVATRFIHTALALLATAHGQAAASTTHCAWYSATTTNFPKGCNNSALADANDATVTFTSDGYGGGNSAKTGSASNLAKTAHNGQACGVVDLNGGMWEVSLGVTAVVSTSAISAATQANPVQVTTLTPHGLTTGNMPLITGVVGMTQLNDRIYTVTVIDATRFTLDGVDGTGFTAWSSGGTVRHGTHYAWKAATAAKDITSGATLATDAWGATGVAAHSSVIVPTFRTDYPNNSAAQRYGNGTTQVFSAATSGDDWVRAALGMPAAATGLSSGGTALFGTDYFYQYQANELCPVAGGGWTNGSLAGVWAVHWNPVRTSSHPDGGFRAASYL